MVKSAQVHVTNAATVLESEGGELLGDQIFIRNTDATNSVFLGGSGVTTATGFELKAGQQIGPLSLNSGDAKLYAIAAVAGPVRVDMVSV